MRNTIIQFVKFGIVGISNTFIGYVIYALSLFVLRKLNFLSDIDIYVSQFMMFLLSVAWSFYWNNRFVFTKRDGEQRHLLLALVKTYISYAFTSLFLAEILLYVMVKYIDVNEFIAPILILFVTVPLNFVIQKMWAFKN